MPLVTAAIVTYNRANYLPDAIESVLGQSFQDIEVLVVDDGSTDATESVVMRYGDRVRYVRQAHSGRAVARNNAVLLADGELIGFCDSDDLWVSDRLERQLAEFDGHPEVGMVHGLTEVIDADGRTLPEESASQRAIFSAAHDGRPTYARYACECRCLSSTILVRRSVFDTVGLYDPRLPIEDYDFYLRLLLAFEIAFLDWPPLAQYRIHDGGTPVQELGLGQIRTAEKHLRLLEERPDIPDAAVARRNFELMIARSWRVLGDRRRARAAALRALRRGAPRALRHAL